MKKIIVLISIAFLSFSCKNDKKASSNNNSKTEFKDLRPTQSAEIEDNFDRFILTIEAIATKDDKFQLMYLTEDIISWSPKGLIKKEITGKDVSQKIVYKFPKDIFPTKFRIELGINKDQKLIDLYKITIEYMGEEVVIEEENIYKFFIPNVYAEYSKDNKSDLTLSENNGRYNPLIITTDYFMKKLKNKLY